MADWKPPQYPPRTSSRYAPGIFVNVEFGVAFSPTESPHTTNFKYTSMKMKENMKNREKMYHQQREELLREPVPSILIPGNRQQIHRDQRHIQQQQQQRPQRPQRLNVNTRGHFQRGGSAPPALTEWNDPVSPMSPLSPIPPISSVSLEVTERRERPLPPLPGRFRLGEDDLPWTTVPFYASGTEFVASPVPARSEPVVNSRRESRRLEDPQRMRELEDLHSAMIAVDSLNNGLDPWSLSESVGETPRGPRSLGWAVSSNSAPVMDSIEDYSSTRDRGPPPPYYPKPPPYVVSQWDAMFGDGASRGHGSRDVRPRSALG